VLAAMRRENDMSKATLRVVLAGLAIVAIGGMSIQQSLAGKPTPPPPPPGPATQSRSLARGTAATITATGAWFADMAEFDAANHWLIDRGGRFDLLSNLVVLSFVNRLRMLKKTDTGLTA